MVLETAVNGAAELLVTLNRRDFEIGASTFDIKIASPAETVLRLRLQPSLMDEARKVAKAEGVAVNQLINVAVAEKISALRTEEYFAERAAKSNVRKALRVLKRAGVDNPPLAGDELPRKRARTG